jgi:hypothetical protein
MVDRQIWDEYRAKTLFIQKALSFIQRNNLFLDNKEFHIDLIDKNNTNNLLLLQNFLPEQTSKVTFWFCKKTIDMNYKTVQRALTRKGILLEEDGS